MSLAEPLTATRRLAAVMAADMAGYSRLMAEDEEGTLARLKAHRRELIDPKITEHHGRLVKTTGDGFLVEFASVVDAVRCGVEIQRAILDRETEVPEAHRIRFRIGINLGDIIVDGDDIFGDGVNIAARLETLAEAGGLCLSGTVRDHIGERLTYPFADIGEQPVKNIPRPVRAYALSADAVAATALVPVQEETARRSFRHILVLAAALVLALAGAGYWWLWPGTVAPPRTPPSALVDAAARPAPHLSLVVLPFANLSNDPEQQSFADAITDDLTTDLSRIEGSFVISRTTALAYKGKPIDVKETGAALGVRYVLEGSVRRMGEQIQTNVQLTNSRSGAQVWSDRFDTARTDLARAQSDIGARLARSLNMALLEAAAQEIDEEPNPSAADLVIRGWANWYRPEMPQRLEDTRQFFERALTFDPDSVEARVGIATVLIEQVLIGASKDQNSDRARADVLLTEALNGNRNYSRLHWALGMLRRQQGRLDESRIEFETTLALDPNNAGAMLQLANTLIGLGKPEAALPQYDRALRITPPSTHNIFFFYYGLGACHLFLGHLDEAIELLSKAKTANARLFWVHLNLAAAYALRGDTDEAKAAYADMLANSPRYRTLEELRKHPGIRMSNPDVAAMYERTLFAGLRLAGMREQ